MYLVSALVAAQEPFTEAHRWWDEIDAREVYASTLQANLDVPEGVPIVVDGEPVWEGDLPPEIMATDHEGSPFAAATVLSRGEGARVRLASPRPDAEPFLWPPGRSDRIDELFGCRDGDAWTRLVARAGDEVLVISGWEVELDGYGRDPYPFAWFDQFSLAQLTPLPPERLRVAVPTCPVGMPTAGPPAVNVQVVAVRGGKVDELVGGWEWTGAAGDPDRFVRRLVVQQAVALEEPGWLLDHAPPRRSVYGLAGVTGSLIQPGAANEPGAELTIGIMTHAVEAAVFVGSAQAVFAGAHLGVRLGRPTPLPRRRFYLEAVGADGPVAVSLGWAQQLGKEAPVAAAWDYRAEVGILPAPDGPSLFQAGGVGAGLLVRRRHAELLVGPELEIRVGADAVDGLLFDYAAHLRVKYARRVSGPPWRRIATELGGT